MAVSPSLDIEKNTGDYAHLTNTAIRSFGWEGITVTVKDRETKQPKDILSDVNGIVKAGELLALMGPSGSGKTTLLNVLAHREATSSATVQQSLYINGNKTSLKDFRKISSYVEQEDALVGSLTVRETLYFAAQLSLPSSVNKVERIARIDALIAAFGLQGQSGSLIGTPIRKGLSGGQKRRVSVAAQLITSPKILFLDEPTSGLDSAASYEVVSFVRNIAKKHNLLVIASIHQPSTTTFELFDKLLLLSRGRTAYNGPVAGVQEYFDSMGYKMPMYMNPAEFVIELVNTDFARDQGKATQQLENIQTYWGKSEHSMSIIREIENAVSGSPSTNLEDDNGSANKLLLPFTLIHRSFIKSYRDVVAYGIRIAMYMGLAVMMGTVWLRLGTGQENINAFTNAIFFGGAFMSFMAVAYIPAFLEDRQLYVKERANGLYGPTSFIVSNFIIGLPYLFIISLLFSIIAYWLSNFRPTAEGFWIWVMWLFLDLVAAEALVVFLSSLMPIFVIALAATAFANGLWMSVDGFMVGPKQLNVFWRYVFHYIDYQGFVFRGMMINEFGSRTYDCDSSCHCMYITELAPQCKIDGKGVLETYGFDNNGQGKYIAYMLLIILGYRILGWVVLYLRRR
ncbi:putative ABC transporter [Lepidopterella palustris CBS 459.81]|uniref:Putative ABC transporter n=1 Tax=Lepidopterella palustris CBS 459.81 TaxID=1314670 RepID=A0A8E2ED80_9PEZI|nr:putative ABC transporter [Lepidopterella palustris CBS 459.81]